MKALKAYNTEVINRFYQRKVHNTEIVETPQDDPSGPPVPENDLPDPPESDLEIPDDPILNFVNSHGILQSWTILTHLVMGSLLGTMTLMRDLPLILTLMSLALHPKGNTNSQYSG